MRQSPTKTKGLWEGEGTVAKKLPDSDIHLTDGSQ